MRYLTLLLLTQCILLFGCSSSQDDPVSMSYNVSDLENLPLSLDYHDIDTHMMLGTWKAEFDFTDETVNVTQTRNLTNHINVTFLIPPPRIYVRSFDPSSGLVDVDVTISNTTHISVFDVRLIIFRDDNGTSLKNADGWTQLYNISQGWPINPFKAYCKSINQRKFSPGSNTENLIIYLPPGQTEVLFAVDASYPGNCPEPYEISNFSHGRLFSQVGSSAIGKVSVYDWQSDVNFVGIYAPQIIGDNIVPFQQADTNVWTTNIVNNVNAQPGEYTGFIIAGSSGSGSLYLFNLVTLFVESDSGWTVTYGGPDKLDGDDIILDNENNIYVVGYFRGSVDFNPGSEQDIKTSNGSTDCYLLKLEPNGNYLWSRTWGGTGEDYACGINIDSMGNIYVCGRFSGTCDFDPGPETDIHQSKGGWDCFLSKFDSDGQFIWARTWGSSTSIIGRYEFCGDVVFDKYDNVYVTGHFMGSVDFDPGSGTFIRTSNGDTDAYLSKFDPDGNFIWAKTWGGTQEDQSIELHADRSGNIYVSGFFKGSVDFDPGPGVNVHTSNGGFDVFVSKFDSNGEYIWTVTWGGSQDDQCRVIFSDDAGNTITAGFFGDTVDFDPGDGTFYRTAVGSSDIFLLKLDPDGNFIWAQTWGGTSHEHVYGATIDPFGDIVVSGYFFGTCDFDPSENNEYYHSQGGQDIFISKYNANGEYLWTNTFGSIGEDVGGGIITDELGNIYATGRFEGTIDFDPGDEIDEHTSLGSTDGYVIKLKPNGYY